ncbi:hypothetical protein ACH4CE_17320 [Streptomyces gelaticus]|uniref:hypothetical protein n=1 Tax=Streptomyces gelaticus TaxID=285446 RepID=UPI00379908B4
MAREGLRVTIHGDLPPEVLERMGDSVRRAVLNEVAELDLAPPLPEAPFGNTDSPRDAVEALMPWREPMGIAMAQEE